MTDRPGLFMVGEAFCFGAIAPAGLLYALSAIPLPEAVSAVGDGLLLGWLLVIALASAVLGSWRRLTTDSLLGGGLLGTIVGWLGFALLVGSDLVLLAVAPLGGVAIAGGAWLAYEHRRRHGIAREPPWGSWRIVFALFGVLLLAPVALLLVL